MRESSYKADLNVNDASQSERYYKDSDELTLKRQIFHFNGSINHDDMDFQNFI